MKVVYFEDCLTVFMIFLFKKTLQVCFLVSRNFCKLVLTKCLRTVLSLLMVCENMKKGMERGLDANSLGNGEHIYFLPLPSVTGDVPIHLYIVKSS